MSEIALQITYGKQLNHLLFLTLLFFFKEREWTTIRDDSWNIINKHVRVKNVYF